MIIEKIVTKYKIKNKIFKIKMQSGNKDTDLLILQELDDRSLMNTCVLNSYFASLCKDENFWMNRIIKVHGEDALLLKAKSGNLNNREIYFRLTYPMYKKCFNVKKNADSNLVIEDLYGPKGYIQTDISKAFQEFKNYVIFKTVYTLTEESEKRGEKINKTVKTKLGNKIKKAFANLPSKYSKTVSFSLKLEDTDIASFYAHVLFSKERINFATITEYSILNLNRKYELFDDDYKFIYKIHEAFKNRQLPLTVTWDEICTHPIFAKKIDRKSIDHLLR